MQILQMLGDFLSANLAAVIFLVLGIVLMGIEIFMPGFGVPGISGIVLLVIGIVLATDSVIEALILILAILAILGALVAVAMRSATKGRISKSPLILKTELNKEAGFSSAKDMEYFVGREGVTVTLLRPAGMADFDGVKLDVVSDGEFMETGTRVRITNVEGRRIVVREINQQ